MTVLESGGIKQQTIQTISNLRMTPIIGLSVNKGVIEEGVNNLEILSGSLKKTLSEKLILNVQNFPQIENLKPRYLWLIDSN